MLDALLLLARFTSISNACTMLNSKACTMCCGLEFVLDTLTMIDITVVDIGRI